MKTAFIVLGAQRSGTSATSHLLSEFNINFGNADRFIQFEHNPIFFELKWVNDFNNRVVSRLGHTYTDLFFPVESDYESLDQAEIVTELRSLIQQEWNGNSCIGIKDPRISLTFPIWEKALLAEGYSLNIVLVFRHPINFLASNKRLFHNWKGWTDNRHLLFWAQFNLAAIYFTRHYQLYYLDYDHLIHHPVEDTTALAECFQLAPTLIEPASRIIQPSYTHHQTTIETGNAFVDRCYRSLCLRSLSASDYLLFRQSVESVTESAEESVKASSTSAFQ
jgi:hypothetical protein